jgi:hypothetical protein
MRSWPELPYRDEGTSHGRLRRQVNELNQHSHTIWDRSKKAAKVRCGIIAAW